MISRALSLDGTARLQTPARALCASRWATDATLAFSSWEHGNPFRRRQAGLWEPVGPGPRRTQLSTCCPGRLPQDAPSALPSCTSCRPGQRERRERLPPKSFASILGLEDQGLGVPLSPQDSEGEAWALGQQQLLAQMSQLHIPGGVLK